MTVLTMYRKPLNECSIGVMVFPKFIFHTIEKPLIITPEWRGGKPYESCIPFGRYEIVPHSGKDYQDVWALVNHDLGVYHTKDQRKFDTDRFGCLIHWGNWVHDVVGCVAVGLGASYDPPKNEYMVTSSRPAINMLRTLLTLYTHLDIKPYS